MGKPRQLFFVSKLHLYRYVSILIILHITVMGLLYRKYMHLCFTIRRFDFIHWFICVVVTIIQIKIYKYITICVTKFGTVYYKQVLQQFLVMLQFIVSQQIQEIE